MEITMTEIKAQLQTDKLLKLKSPQEIPALLNSSHARVRLLAVNSIQGGAWTSYAWSVHARATADMTWA